MKGAKSKTGSKKSDKLAVSKKGAVASKQKQPRGKAVKDPNKPKRSPSAFFVFMDEFRKQYKQDHPNNKSVAAVGKAGGEKWKSMSDSEKKRFVEKAEKLKIEYEVKMKEYNEKSEGVHSGEDGDSDKSKSEVNDVDGDDEGSGEDEE